MTKEISEEEYIDLQKRIQKNMIDWLQPYLEKLTTLPEPDNSAQRDWFAGMALQGMATAAGYQGLPWDRCAKQAYDAADQMLKQRKISPTEAENL